MSRTRIVKGNITKIIGGNYKMFSKENIENIGSKVIQIGKEKGVIYGEPKDPPVLEVDILADAIVHFRPMKDWKGKEYGFDWMRIDDTDSNDNKYSKIVGTYDTYPSTNNTGESNATLSTFTKSPSMYNNLRKEYSNPVFKVSWLPEDKKPSDYFASWLCVEKNKEVYLSLRVLIKDKENPPKELVIEYDKSVCEITTSQGKGTENEKLDPAKKKKFAKITIKREKDYKLRDEFKIKVLADIDTPQTLKVLCDGKDAGFLKLYPNKVKRLNVVCVKVTTKVNVEGKIKGKTELENYLKQSLISINVVEEVLDISKKKDGSKNLDLKLPTITDGININMSGDIRGTTFSDYMDIKLKEKYVLPDGRGKYDKHLRLYFFKEKAFIVYKGTNVPIGGIGTPIGGARGFMFDDINDVDVAHEAMHSIALGHSFGVPDNVSIVTPYLFEYMKTENVMDYANLGGKDKYST